jgi:hypothetical protein
VTPPHSSVDAVRLNCAKKRRPLSPPPGGDTFNSTSANPRVVLVPTYAASTDMSNGSLRSTETFHDWMYPRFTFSGSGVRIVVVDGSGTRPCPGSGPGTAGMPLASVSYGCQLFRPTHVFAIVSG